MDIVESAGTMCLVPKQRTAPIHLERCRALFLWLLTISIYLILMLCRACGHKLDVPTMLLVGDSDYYFRPEMWQKLDLHVTNCWLPRRLEKCSHWCPQDR